MTPEERTLTAHHEAGHAVVAHALEVRIRFVSIAPGGDHLGRAVLEDWPEWFDRELRDEASVTHLRKAIMIVLSGPLAETKVARARYASLARLHGDRQAVRDWVVRLSPDPQYLAQLEGEASRRLDPRWHQVKELAAALLDRETLTGAEVHELLHRVD